MVRFYRAPVKFGYKSFQAHFSHCRDSFARLACDDKEKSRDSDAELGTLQCNEEVLKLRDELELLQKTPKSDSSIERKYFRQYVRTLLRYYSKSVS